MSGHYNLRSFLWTEDKKCFWCNKETILTFMSGGSFDPDEATIDHYFSRYHMEERVKWGNPVVLACYKCNHDRGAKETKEQPIEELWRRAGHYEEVVERRRISTEALSS